MSSETPQSYFQEDLYHKGSQLSTPQTVFGLLNGMIGGTILILPLLGLATGSLMSTLVCAVLGIVSYYTAYLVVVHIGKGTIKDWILQHFNNDRRYLTGFNIIMVVNNIPGYLIYFKLICLQIESIFTVSGIWVPVLVSVALLVMIFLMRIYHFGQKTLALGLITIISFLVFLAWTQITAPSGPHQVPLSGNPLNLSSTLLYAYAVHTLLMQNILKNPKKGEYISVIRYTFFFGFLIYLFILMGSFAIVNRQPIVKHPQIISDYFPAGQWQVILIQVIYLFHLSTVLPMNTIVSKIRFFQIFGVEVKKELDLKEGIYLVSIVLFGILMETLNISLQTIISLNGAIIMVLLDIIFPMWIHYRCVLIDRHSGQIQGDDEWNAAIQPNACRCEIKYRSKWILYAEIFMMIMIALASMFLMVTTLMTI